MSRRGVYAEGSKVPEDRSRAELQKEIQRFGATHFVIGEAPDRVRVGFQYDVEDPVGGVRRVMFELKLPPPPKDLVGGYNRDIAADRRRRWRCLILLVKAKLTAVEDGIATFDDEFLAHIVLPSGKTVGETVDVGAAISSGELPALMPGL